MSTIQDRIKLTSVQIRKLKEKAETLEELHIIDEIGRDVQRAKLRAALGEFRANTHKFVKVASRIAGSIVEINKAHPGAGTPALDILLGKYGGVLTELHEKDGMRKTFDRESEPEIDSDEDAIKPTERVENIPTDKRPETILNAPVPINSRSYEQLADEYIAFFLRSKIKPGREGAINKAVELALASRGRYLNVGNHLNIPWWFIAGVHMLESTFNFTTHLHNGDPLTNRTVRVPTGRPADAPPPFNWEISAQDALKRQKLADLKDWTLARALWRWERYNGFGYRSQKVPTPYLWSFSTIYERGKFVRDGKFNADAVSAQCGAAVLLKALHSAGEVPDLGIDLVVEDESHQQDADRDISDTVDFSLPNIDNDIPAGSDFEVFFARHFPDVTHFEWHEFLIKGASNAQNPVNTDPPPELWPNAVPLIRTLEAFRKEIKQPVVLTSVYRSPAYNKTIGGANRSQHMAFTAADFKVANKTDTGDWAARLKRLREQGSFEGGIGIYNTFVHVDVRGVRADWDKRT